VSPGYAWTDLEGLVLEGALLVLGEAVGDEAGRVGERVVVGLEGGAVPARLVGAIGAGAAVVLEAVAARVGRTLQVAQLLEGAELAGNQLM